MAHHARHFEAADRRFDSVDRRFERLEDEMDVRFNRIDDRLYSIQRTMLFAGLAMSSAFIAGLTGMIALVATQI